MHIPESLQDLADSEAVQFLKKPKTITRICAGVRPSCGPTAPRGDRTQALSPLRPSAEGAGGRKGLEAGKESRRELMAQIAFY